MSALQNQEAGAESLLQAPCLPDLLFEAIVEWLVLQVLLLEVTDERNHGVELELYLES